MCTKTRFYLPVSELGVSIWNSKQVDGEVLSGRTEYALYAIVDSRMKLIFYFIVVDWSIYDYYIVILSSESRMSDKTGTFIILPGIEPG